MSDNPGIFKRVFSALWSGLTRLRLALSNVLFLLVIVLLLALFSGRTPEPLPVQAALILNPAGSIVEQKSYVDPMTLLFSEPVPREREVLLRDVIAAIRAASDDPAITSLVMDLDGLWSVGISKTGEIATALADFRASGKPIIARGDSYTQSQYLLATEADTIILHPMGGVLLEGFANYKWYFADALEKLSLNMHVFKAGDFKSVADPFEGNEMPAGEKEISQRWLDSLWSHYTGKVESARTLEQGSVDAYIGSFAEQLAGEGGDMAQWAMTNGLVDQLQTRAEANAFLIDVVGAEDEFGNYQGIAFDYYLEHKQPRLADSAAGEKVGVVTAKGMILDGDQPAGRIGGDSLANLLQEAIEDESIRAIVLRVDSGGGSAFASEIIYQRLLMAAEHNKPVVVSMGSVAASGGYWIAAPADEIWATPTTITGSIGVISAFPTADRLLDRIGIHSDGVGTTPLAGALRLDRPLIPEAGALQQMVVDNLYQRFISRVADGRNMEIEAVDAVASGRVWSGADAQKVGLVDQLGGLDDAIAAAARLAQIEDYQVEYVESQLSPRELLVKQFLGQVAGWLGSGNGFTRSMHGLTATLHNGIELLEVFNDPQGAYARCLGCIAP
jgi:protease-4